MKLSRRIFVLGVTLLIGIFTLSQVSYATKFVDDLRQSRTAENELRARVEQVFTAGEATRQRRVVSVSDYTLGVEVLPPSFSLGHRPSADSPVVTETDLPTDISIAIAAGLQSEGWIGRAAPSAIDSLGDVSAQTKALGGRMDARANEILIDTVSVSGHPVLILGAEGEADGLAAGDFLQRGQILNPTGHRDMEKLITDEVDATNLTVTNNNDVAFRDRDPWHSSGISMQATGGIVDERGGVSDMIYSAAIAASVPSDRREEFIDNPIDPEIPDEFKAAQDYMRKALTRIASANGKTLEDVEVVLMDRGREGFKKEVLLSIGVNSYDFPDGTPVHALLACLQPNPDKVRVFWTVGKSTEGKWNEAVADALYQAGFGVFMVTKLYSTEINFDDNKMGSPKSERKKSTKMSRRYVFSEEVIEIIQQLYPDDWQAVLEGKKLFVTGQATGTLNASTSILTGNKLLGIRGVGEVQEDGTIKVPTLRVRAVQEDGEWKCYVFTEMRTVNYRAYCLSGLVASAPDREASWLQKLDSQRTSITTEEKAWLDVLLALGELETRHLANRFLQGEQLDVDAVVAIAGLIRDTATREPVSLEVITASIVYEMARRGRTGGEIVSSIEQLEINKEQKMAWLNILLGLKQRGQKTVRRHTIDDVIDGVVQGRLSLALDDNGRVITSIFATATSVSELLENIAGVLEFGPDGDMEIIDEDRLRSETIDYLARECTLNTNKDVRESAQHIVREAGLLLGLKPASLHDFYIARNEDVWDNLTNPTFNLRAGVYSEAMQIYRKVINSAVGIFGFELARSETRYTEQRPGEYLAVCTAAGIKEGYTGPMFGIGDHYQVAKDKYFAGGEARDKELDSVKSMIREAILGGNYNIDLDPSTLVDEDALDEIVEFENKFVDAYLAEHQELLEGLDDSGIKALRHQLVDEVNLTPVQEKELNALYQKMHATTTAVTMDLIRYIRGLEKELLDGKVTVAIGIEERHIDNPKHKKNPSTVRGTITLARNILGLCEKEGLAPPCKIALQTGTMHGVGGKIDFGIFKRHREAAKRIGISVFVQHGTSTIEDRGDFNRLPVEGVGEAHLATEYQKIHLGIIASMMPNLAEEMGLFMERLMDGSASYDKKFRAKWDNAFNHVLQQGKSRHEVITEILSDTLPGELKGSLKDLAKEISGPFKDNIWNVPPDVQRAVDKALGEEFSFIMDMLGVAGTRELVESIIPPAAQPAIHAERPQALTQAIAGRVAATHAAVPLAPPSTLVGGRSFDEQVGNLLALASFLKNWGDVREPSDEDVMPLQDEFRDHAYAGTLEDHVAALKERAAEESIRLTEKDIDRAIDFIKVERAGIQDVVMTSTALSIDYTATHHATLILSDRATDVDVRRHPNLENRDAKILLRGLSEFGLLDPGAIAREGDRYYFAFAAPTDEMLFFTDKYAREHTAELFAKLGPGQIGFIVSTHDKWASLLEIPGIAEAVAEKRIKIVSVDKFSNADTAYANLFGENGFFDLGQKARTVNEVLGNKDLVEAIGGSV